MEPPRKPALCKGGPRALQRRGAHALPSGPLGLVHVVVGTVRERRGAFGKVPTCNPKRRRQRARQSFYQPLSEPSRRRPVGPGRDQPKLVTTSTCQKVSLLARH